MTREESELRRLDALHRLCVLDTEPEERFDRLVEMASLALNMPIALVSLVDRERQWFKARSGLAATETPRDIAFCSHAIETSGPEPFVVPDALDDPRFVDNPLVNDDPNVRFYAGQVLRDAGGLAMGTLCVIDRRPRQLDERERQILAHIAALAEQELFRRSEVALLAELEQSQRNKGLILDALEEGLVLQVPGGAITEWNPAAEKLLGMSGDELCGRTSTDPRWHATHSDGTPWPGDAHPAMIALATGRPDMGQVMGVHRPGRSRVWLRVNATPIVGDNGRVEAALTAFTDVTAEIEAHRSVAVLNSRLHDALDASGTAVALVDGAGAITYVNRAFASLVDRPTPKLVGQDLLAVVDPDDRAQVSALLGLNGTARPDQPGVVEVRAAELDKWIEVRVAPLSPLGDASATLVQIEDITARRATHDQLVASEARVRDLLDHIPVPLIARDEGGRIVYANPAAADALGLSAPSDLVGTSALDHVHPDDRMAFTQAWLNGFPVEVGEVRVVRADGSTWLANRFAKQTHLDGENVTVAAFVDITAEREALDAVAGSERRMSIVMETIDEGIVLFDEQGAVEVANRAAARLIGVPEPEHLRYRTFDDVLGSLPLAPGTEPLDPTAMLGQRDLGGMSDVGLLVDGVPRWLRMSATPLDSIDGGFAGMILTYADITAEHERVAQLAASEAQLRQLTDAAPLGIYINDHDGRRIYSNPEWCEMTGMGAQDALGDGWLAVVHPDDRDRLRDSWSLFTVVGGETVFDYRLCRGDGAVRWAESNVQQMLDGRFVGIVVDVTERHEREAKLTHRANHDPLTGLPNRALLTHRLTASMSGDGRKPIPSVLFIDLDFFKRVNDTHGHGAGDTLLQQVAERLLQVVRSGDTVARLGGDEFVVICHGADEPAIDRIGHRMLDALHSPFDLGDGVVVSIGGSIGVAQAIGSSAADVIARADAAAYEAKRSGRGQLVFNRA